jgi:hypothetical protein
MLSVNAVNAYPQLAQRTVSLPRPTLQFGSSGPLPTPPSSGRGNTVKNIVLYLLAGLGLIAVGRESNRLLDTKAPPAATAKDDKTATTTTTTTTSVASPTVTTSGGGASVVTGGGYSSSGVSGYLHDPSISPSVPGYENNGGSGYLDDPGVVIPVGGSGYNK